jgi:parvulin-like peptidyl-prolyl isomerase
MRIKEHNVIFGFILSFALAFFLQKESYAMGTWVEKEDIQDIVQQEINETITDNDLESRIQSLNNNIDQLQEDKNNLDNSLSDLQISEDRLKRSLINIIHNERLRNVILLRKGFPTESYTSYLLSPKSDIEMTLDKAIEFCRSKTDGYPKGSWSIISKDIYQKLENQINDRTDYGKFEWFIDKEYDNPKDYRLGIRRNYGSAFYDLSFFNSETAFVRCAICNIW